MKTATVTALLFLVCILIFGFASTKAENSNSRSGGVIASLLGGRFRITRNRARSLFSGGCRAQSLRNSGWQSDQDNSPAPAPVPVRAGGNGWGSESSSSRLVAVPPPLLVLFPFAQTETRANLNSGWGSEGRAAPLRNSGGWQAAK